MKPINLKFCAQFKINIQKPVSDFSLLYPRQNGLEENEKCVEWILRLSNRD